MQNTSFNTNNTLPASIFTAEYTFAYGSYFCLKWMYPIHISFAYLVGIVGILAFVTRMFNRLKFLHTWFGRLFVIFMFCTMATSLMIYNTGLPTAIMVFFFLLTIGLSVGILSIKLHMMLLEKQALKMVQEKITKLLKGEVINSEEKLSEMDDLNPEKRGIMNVFNLENEINLAKGIIVNSKGVLERFISFKALHGLGMFVAWWNIFGRILVTNPMIWLEHGCYTYPAHKNPTGIPTYVPETRENADFISNVPLFVFVAFVPAFLLFIAIGFIFSLVAGIVANKQKNKAQEAKL